MRIAPFSGIKILDPSDPITIDGASFQSTDRETIDRFLEVGAVTHRHDAHAPLPDPAGVASAWTEASGGAIRANQPIYVGYTLEDEDGGETLISQIVNVTTPAPYEEPDTPLAGSADYTGGQLVADTYYYGITLIDGEGGETPLGPVLTVEREPGYASGRVRLGDLAAELNADAVAWRLYRAIGGGDWYLLTQGTANLYTDDGTAAADPSQKPPENDALNTTNRTNRLKVKLPSTEPYLGSAAAIKLYLSGDGLFGNPSLYQRFPVGSAGQVIPIPSLALQPGAPPDVSTAIGGASKIDPDTDILDWHWKRPVSTYTALGSGDPGDVRAALDTGQLYEVVGGSATGPSGWTPLRLRIVKDSAGGIARNPEFLSFAAGAGTQVTVASGGGSASVLISASGVGGLGQVAASADGSVISPTALMFAGSGATVTVTQEGASAIVTIAPKGQRVNASAATATLASGASAAANFALSDQFELLKIGSSRSCRVRLYATATQRDADAGRAIGTDPSGDHGVILDFVLPTADLSWTMAPIVLGANLESPVTGFIPAIITNMDSSAQVVASLLFIPR
jgi:hypothetical protein